MDKKNKDKKFIGQLSGEELFLVEAKLAKYEGVDRMVSSLDLAIELDKTEDSSFIVPTGIPSLDSLHEGGIEAGEVWIFSGPSGEGKSLKKGTSVLCYDGLYKKVEDLQVGEQLMGKDSTPRNVLSLGNGREEMFKVTPVRGESFVCNKSHILSVVRHIQHKKNGKKWIEPYYSTLHLTDYLKLSATQKKLTLLYRVGVDWQKKHTPLEPYFLGLWLGDGTKGNLIHLTHSNEDVELSEYHKKNGEMSVHQDKRGRGLLHRYSLDKEILKNLPQDKHIPMEYKVNSRDNRLQLLAGIIDSDGYTNRTGYVFCNKNEQLAEDVLFVARSLGFFAQKKEFTGCIKSTGFEGQYWKVYISGDCSVIPVKIKRKKVAPRKINKNILRTGIKSVESIGEGEYYGITLDGDHEYLLKDFTVTHNTTITMTMTQNMAEAGIKTAWFTLEVTPRQFIKKMKARANNVPLFYLPNENKDPVVSWIEERIVEAKVKYDCKVVFIDHLQQIFSMARMENPNGNLSWEIGDLMAKIKSIATMHDIAVVLIAHTKDDPSGSSREPRKEDIRDSGLVQRLADSIIMIWRVPDDDELKNSRRKIIESGDAKAKVRIVKNRRTGTLGTWFMLHKDHYLEEVGNSNKTTNYGTARPSHDDDTNW